MADERSSFVCLVNDDTKGNKFVGISCEKDGKVEVHFPLGYRLSGKNGSDEARRDALLLIRVLSGNTGQRESELRTEYRTFSDESVFPIQAYIFLIRDFLDNGYYVEAESLYVRSKRGRIDWGRTIKTQRAYIQDDEAYYLEFITKQKRHDEDQIITLIHEYCVYEAFKKMGWLFGVEMTPRKPRIEFQEDLFVSVLSDKINGTFNDRNRSLFRNMLAMVFWLIDKNAPKEFYYGTYEFEHVWQRMVDRVYGIKDKKEYFPRTVWHVNGEDKENNSLLPDTVMLYEEKIYVLDSKYYKYGATGELGNLPHSADINKQITYGEYIAQLDDTHKEEKKVYNAFILPFDAEDKKHGFDVAGYLSYAGYATADWKSDGNTYEYEVVHAVLLDVKHLMERTVEEDEGEIKEMADIIGRGSEANRG